MAKKLSDLQTTEAGVQYLVVSGINLTLDKAQQMMASGSFQGIDQVDFFEALSILGKAKAKDVKAEGETEERRKQEQARLEQMKEIVDPIREAVLPKIEEFLASSPDFRLSFKTGNIHFECNSGIPDERLQEWSGKLDSPNIHFSVNDAGEYVPAVKSNGTRQAGTAVLGDGMYELPADKSASGESINFEIMNGRISAVYDSDGNELEKPRSGDSFLLTYSSIEPESDRKNDKGEFVRPYSWAMQTVAKSSNKVG